MRPAKAGWVHGLTLVLDDEPLIVLDPDSGCGFQLTMSGIGDNYQLHTLLADRLTARQCPWRESNPLSPL